MKRAHLIIAGVALIGAGAAFFQINHAGRQAAAQAGYDYGKQIGRTLGMCETLANVAKANPDSEWAHSTVVREALEGCAPLFTRHGPNTTETIKVPWW